MIEVARTFLGRVLIAGFGRRLGGRPHLGNARVREMLQHLLYRRMSLKLLDLASLEHLSVDAVHLCVEANKLAHADKNRGFGAEDTALALSYLELYAPVSGLGTCWAGYFYSAVNAYPPLFEALSLPAKHKAFGAMMVGYPKFRYQRLVPRKPPKVNWV